MAECGRIAAIYDIYGKLLALEAVLQDIRQAGGKIYPGGINIKSSTVSRKIFRFHLTDGCNLICCVFRDKRASPMRGVGVLPGSGFEPILVR
jgi:hypothetical protein